jgi:hypothetical protein
MVAWYSPRIGPGRWIFSVRRDGRGVIERLTESPNAQNPNAFAPDGTLLFNQRSRAGERRQLLMIDG